MLINMNYYLKEFKVTGDNDLKASQQPRQTLGPAWESECRLCGRRGSISGRTGDSLVEDMWDGGQKKRRDSTVLCSRVRASALSLPPTSAPYLVHNLDMLFNLSALVWKMKMATRSTGCCED